MFEELWITKDEECIYYEKWTNEPLTVDQGIFTAFIRTLKVFQESIFSGRLIKSIEFFNTRLMYVNSKHFNIAVRERSQKPFERSIRQLRIISDEIDRVIDNLDKYNHLIKDFNLIKQGDYQRIFYSVIHKILDLEEISETQLKTNEFISLIYFARELRNLILIIATDQVLLNIPSTKNTQWIYYAIMNDAELETNLFKDVNYKDMVDYVIFFITQIEKNFKFYNELPDQDKLQRGRTELLKFLAKNKHTISKYKIFEPILGKFILLFKENN